jgi:hypothetical protein
MLARTRFGDRLKVPGAALLLGCALSKEPFLGGVLATWAACFLLTERQSELRTDALRYVKLTGLGAGLVVFALCVYMIPTGAMKAYLQTFIGYFRFYRDPLQSYCVVLGRFHPTTPLNDLHLQFDQARREYLNLATMGHLLPFALVSLIFIPRRSWLLLAAVVVTVLLALHSVTASNCQWPHYYMLSVGGLFFALVVGLDSMTVRLRNRLANRLVGAVLLVSAIMAIWPRYQAERPLYGTRQFQDPYRDLIPGTRAAVQRYTTPADRIFTTGPPLLYVQVDRISAVRESTIIDEGLGFYDGKTDEEKLSGIRAQLEANMPKLFILDPENANRKVRHDKALLRPFLTSHEYTEIAPHVWLRPY